MRCLLKKVILIVACMLILNPVSTHAAENRELSGASLDYVSALVSLATYNDRAGLIAREELTKRHWIVKSYSERFKDIDAKFIVVDNVDDNKESYILAVTGTENIHDVRTDMNFSKVFFGGSTPEEFVELAKTKDTTSKDPMVHRGFNKYTNTAFFTKETVDGKTYGEYLAGFLKEDPERKIYMVGHSLGGAVVTLGAARLISLGVDPKQLEVITFGAPAIGNSAFVEQYGSKIPLRRIAFGDDPIKSILQSVSGGYVQLGETVVWNTNRKIYAREHSIGVYLDSAMRQFYDEERAAAAAGRVTEWSIVEREGKNKCYVAPLDIMLTDNQEPDHRYFRDVMYNVWRDTLDGFVFAQGEKESLDQLLAKARAKGCQWLLISDLDVTKVQNKKFGYYVSYVEAVYDVNTGNLKGSLMYTNGTKDFTALQSMFHNLVQAQAERERIFQMN